MSQSASLLAHGPGQLFHLLRSCGIFSFIFILHCFDPYPDRSGEPEALFNSERHLPDIFAGLILLIRAARTEKAEQSSSVFTALAGFEIPFCRVPDLPVQYLFSDRSGGDGLIETAVAEELPDLLLPALLEKAGCVIDLCEVDKLPEIAVDRRFRDSFLSAAAQAF